MSVQRLGGRIYAECDYPGANVACIDTGDGLVLIDTPMTVRDIGHWKDFLRALDPRGAAFLVNTHAHFEHCVGNARLGGRVIMHRKESEMLAAYNEPERLRTMVGRIFPSLNEAEREFIVDEPRKGPDLVLDGHLTLQLGEATIDILFTGGHTPGSLCVYHREQKALFTGDNLTAGKHPVKTGGNLEQWIAALRRLDQLDIESIVPGHGPVCDRSELARCLAYFEHMDAVMRECLAQGRNRDATVEEVHRQLIGFYPIDAAVEGAERAAGLKKVFDIGTGQLYDELVREGAAA